MNETFYTTKKVYTNGNRTVVISYQLGAGADAANYLYKVHALSITGATVTLVHNFTGTAYNAAPGFSVSSDLLTVVVYHRSTATGNPYTFVGRTLNYETRTALTIAPSPFFSTGVPMIFVGNRGLYAQKTVADGSGNKHHQVFLVNGDKLIPYNDPWISATTYDRVILKAADYHRIRIIVQSMPSTSLVL